MKRLNPQGWTLFIALKAAWGGLILVGVPFAQAQIALEVGEQRVLRFKQISQFSLSGDSVRATRTGLSVLIKAIKPGPSELVVLTDEETLRRSFRVHAPSSRGSEPTPLVRSASQLQELEVFLSGDTATLRGRISHSEEAARVAALARAFPKQLQNESTLSEALLNQAAERLAEWINGSESLRVNLRVQRLDQGVRVLGVLDDPSDRPSIERTARGIFPLVELELEALSQKSPVVHFKVFLLELKKNHFSSLGLSWQDSIRGAFRVSPWRVERNLSLESAIQVMEGNGTARVLSKPELVVRAPGEAELFSGGELPIKTSNQFATQVQWKNFGLLLRLKVAESTARQVRVDIQTEISSLSMENGLEDVPGLAANRMRTQVDAVYGTPLLLSGLIQNQERERLKGIPGLRHIPILGRLFESRDYLSDQSELVAILVPNNRVPQAPMGRVEPEYEVPRGPLPKTSARLSGEQMRSLRASEEFPWNAL